MRFNNMCCILRQLSYPTLNEHFQACTWTFLSCCSMINLFFPRLTGRARLIDKNFLMPLQEGWIYVQRLDTYSLAHLESFFHFAVAFSCHTRVTCVIGSQLSGITVNEKRGSGYGGGGCNFTRGALQCISPWNNTPTSSRVIEFSTFNSNGFQVSSCWSISLICWLLSRMKNKAGRWS